MHTDITMNEWIDYEKILAIDPFVLEKTEKQALYRKVMAQLTQLHRQNCKTYRQLTDKIGTQVGIPVRLFKEFDLKSIQDNAVFKVMTSSGTSGQAVSRIYLDRETSQRQSKVLSRIVSDFSGRIRMPMLIIDTPSVIKNRASFSARGAGILGFSMLGRDLTYALDENMNVNFTAVEAFFDRHWQEKVFLFGFTFMIWQYFLQALIKENIHFKADGILVHGGGWKKLENLHITNEAFQEAVKETTGIQSVCNYYGMVEQTGSIFMECEYGHLHTSVFSDVNVLSPFNLTPVPMGEKGIIECCSLLPTSYPGHRLLTEDEGIIEGEDDCPCGRKGKYFRILGRIPGAEIRGCSDTYERR